MPFDELKNLLVEDVRPLPCYRMTRIGYDRPFMVLQVSGPDQHQGRRRKQIGVRVVLFLLFMAGITYAVKRRLWSGVHH